jgi:Flp pilus assembly protein TadG
MAMLMPWFLFLFVGAFDWGYYAHALISTESAARVAALYTSQNSSTTTSSTANDTAACNAALGELSIAPNVAGLTSCTSLPVIVSYSSVATGADGNPASQVTVQYQTLKLIPIPGLLNNQFTIQRTVQMRLRG